MGEKYSEQERAVIERLKEAKKEYSKESAIFHRIRRSIAPKDLRTPEQHAIYEIARERFSTASKKLQREELIYNSAMHPVMTEARVSAAMDEMVMRFKEVIQGVSPSSIAVEEVEKKHIEQAAIYGSHGDPGFERMKEQALEAIRKHEEEKKIKEQAKANAYIGPERINWMKGTVEPAPVIEGGEYSEEDLKAMEEDPFESLDSTSVVEETTSKDAPRGEKEEA